MYGEAGGLVRCFRATIGGQIAECNVSCKTLDECTLQVCKGEGAYTVIPVYSSGLVANRWNEHSHRMIESCELLDIPHSNKFCEFTNNEPRFRSLLRNCWSKCGLDSARVRVTFDRELMTKDQPEMLVAIEPWAPYALTSPLYTTGVKVQTLPCNIARQTPKAKHNGWIHERKKITTTNPEAVYEFLLLEKDETGCEIVLEATGCNFIGLTKDNRLVFPDHHVLIGIARAILIDALREHYEIEYRCPPLSEVMDMKELFLCSASRGIFPIIEIDKKPVGSGVPGHVFTQLHGYYNNQLQKELVPL